ncbi:HPr family phosphocarrier protein [Mesoplasma lactucae]|uniref:Phosphocarrier protein HPr n=1 Tax=Mesoplasma lactucae ATCC 49193 TaxID=81460 RepID=A0A291ISC8_9MOLU|nr:HPr family phosphocarrier protein [Mesoplasma lactucae]ATG97616.1 phosphocarrier protein HPr [Mesoplasma lactucae ATCC 49193]ATZ19923.1 phosphocarrier protein HPr [Mesoplasma lactucae ATCC 49193]MCL8216787.1 Phosphocarrier protein HPr [Mesoplasma lactucae ATCC 49193]
MAQQKFTATIIDKVGLHARPTSQLAKEASKYKSDIKIFANGKQGNLKSIMNVMAMAVKSGDEVTIEADGPDANEACDGIKKVMQESGLIAA